MHPALMRFEKRKQREEETTDNFLDDLEKLRRRSKPDESNGRKNLAVASLFIDVLKSDKLRAIIATHYTPLSTNASAATEIQRMILTETFNEIKVLQEQLWQF